MCFKPEVPSIYMKHMLQHIMKSLGPLTVILLAFYASFTSQATAPRQLQDNGHTERSKLHEWI
jgi:hypothetical protein